MNGILSVIGVLILLDIICLIFISLFQLDTELVI